MALVDFVFITALLEEFEALRQALSPNVLTEVSDNSQVWFRTTVENKNQSRKYHIVATYQNKLGSFDAISITKDCIDRWHPAYIIMTGIAGSFHESVRLGDIAVAQQIFHYSMGKATDQKKQIKTEYRPEGYPCSVTLIRQTELVSTRKNNEWQKKGKQRAKKMANQLKAKSAKGTVKLIKMLKEHNGSVHFGTMASGSLVITSVNKKKELLRLHGKIIATEMEGAGIMHQAYYQEIPVAAIIIKGISDFADSKKTITDKHGYWRKLALQNVSNFAVELLKTGTIRALHTDEFDLSIEKGGPALARDLINRPVVPGNSFLSFPHLVIPEGPLTGITIEVIASNTNGLLNIPQFVVQYFDKGGHQQTIYVNGNIFKLSGFISRAPIGVYLMIMGQASTLKFTVSTFNVKKEAEIQIP